jgi:hypothetical protein
MRLGRPSGANAPGTTKGLILFAVERGSRVPVPRRGYTTQPRVSTPGFNPGNRISLRRALKGLQIVRAIPPIKRIVISRPFRANPLTRCFPGFETLG